MNTRLWIWRGIRVRLPDDWEMLQFARTAASGRCLFADRYQFRLELNWKAVEGPPDFDRMLADYRHKLIEDKTLESAHPGRRGGWHTLDGRGPGGWSSRCGRHLAEPGLVVELVFLWPDAVGEALRDAILDSVAVEPSDGQVQRWRAFGMDMRATAGLSLAVCTALPALARLQFSEGRQAGARETFERMGLVAEWLNTTPAAWLHSRDLPGLRNAQRGTRTLGGHAIAGVCGTAANRAFPRLGRAPLAYQAAAWLCPADGRLYAYRTITPRNGGAAVPEADVGRLRCCPDMEAACER